MRHKVNKFFTIAEFEKEEEWLNEMSIKGFQLVSVSGIRYEFEEGEKGEYVYRLELLDYMPSHSESKAYIQFLEEAGVEMIGSYLRWAYFRKRADTEGFNIYSDIESKIRHYKRIEKLGACIIGINFFIAISSLIFLSTHLLTGKMDVIAASNSINLAWLVISTIFGCIVYRAMKPVRSRVKELTKEQIIRE